MNPNTGEIITAARVDALRDTDPVRAAQFTVRLDGPPEDVEKVGAAIRAHYDEARRAKNRAKNKAARKARKLASR